MRRLTAAERHELSLVTRRAGVALMAVARALAMPAVAVLGLLSGGSPGTVLALGGLGALSVVAGTAWQWRTAGRSRLAVLAPLGAELAVLLATAAASGGGASHVVYLLIVVPLAATLVMRPVELVGLAVASLGGLAVVDRPGLLVWGVELAWVTAVSVVLAARRETLLARVAHLDALRAALLAAVPDPGRSERRRLAAVLHETVLEPLRAISAEAVTGPVGRLGVMVGDLDRIERSMRDVVAELHSPSGGRSELVHGLRSLAERRTQHARVIVEVVRRPPEALDEQLLTLARYLLEAVAGPRSRVVWVRVDAEGAAARLDVSTGGPETPLDGPAFQALRERVALLGAQVYPHEAGRGVVAQLGPLEGVPGVDARMPGRHEPLAVRAVSIARGGASVAVVLVGGLIGGQLPGAWIVAALLVATSPFVMWVLRSGRFGLKSYATVAILDQALYLTGFALAGDTQAALVPLVVAVPACYALLLAPGPTVLAGAAFGLGALAVADLPAGFAVAYAWAMGVAYLLAAGAAGASRLVNQLARRRRALQGRLLAEEEAARRRLAGDLHDDALQLLLSVRQDFVEAAEGDRRSAWRAFEVLAMLATTLTRTLGELEEREAEPVTVGGLSSALFRVVAGASERAGPPVRLEVDEGAGGLHDGLIVRLVRELVLNARKHAEASAIRVDVLRDDEEVIIEVADDGVGWDHGRVASAAADGHIGLASASERVALAGGRLELVDRPAGGAAVRTVLPAS